MRNTYDTNSSTYTHLPKQDENQSKIYLKRKQAYKSQSAEKNQQNLTGTGTEFRMLMLRILEA